MAPAKLVLLATDRAGYARLSRLITTGRRRSGKGRYALYWSDLDDGLPGCLALLCPEPPSAQLVQTQASTQAQTQTQAQALQTRMPGRAWIAVELLGGADDRAQLTLLRHLSQHSGLPLVAEMKVHPMSLIRRERAFAQQGVEPRGELVAALLGQPRTLVQQLLARHGRQGDAAAQLGTRAGGSLRYVTDGGGRGPAAPATMRIVYARPKCVCSRREWAQGASAAVSSPSSCHRATRALDAR
jgi:hypothetical protein